MNTVRRWVNYLLIQVLRTTPRRLPLYAGLFAYVSSTLGFTLLSFADPNGQKDLPLALVEFLDWIHSHRFWLGMGTAALVLIAGLVQYVSAKLLVRMEAIQVLLERCLEIHFSEPNRLEHFYRVTLFVPRRLRFTWCHPWLGAIARAAVHGSNRLPLVSFLIPERESTGHRGIAGECWRQNGATIIKLLPAVEPSDPSAVENYLREGWITMDEYKDLDQKAVTFYATGIKKNGKMLAILVLDTTEAGQMPTNSARRWEERHFETCAIALSCVMAEKS